jgi:putative ABC transport system permease protein
LQAVTGLPNLKAFVPIGIGIIFILISVVLTMFAGIIPSRSAAKKDPVIALRTE